MFHRSYFQIVFALPLAVLAFACGSTAAHAQTTIFDQVGTSSAVFNGATSFASNHYTNGSDSSVLVDDFAAPATALNITNVTAAIVGFGGTFKSLANVTGWEVLIYAAAPTATTTSLAGTALADITVSPAAATLTTPYDTSANSGLISLPVNIALPAAGTYYLAVAADNSLTANGEVAVYSTAKGFLGGAAPFPAGGENDFDFDPGASGLFAHVITAEAGDAAYQITAQPAAVPEPSVWALLGAGALVAVVVDGARRRARSSAVSRA